MNGGLSREYCSAADGLVVRSVGDGECPEQAYPRTAQQLTTREWVRLTTIDIRMVEKMLAWPAGSPMPDVQTIQAWS